MVAFGSKIVVFGGKWWYNGSKRRKMAKSIKIDDNVYDSLKGMADRDFRTVSQQIAFLIDYYEKNKSQNPAWDIPKPTCGVGSQANKTNTRSYGELKAEKTKLIAEYQEKMNYCQDYGERDRLQHELDGKLKPIQDEIDEMFRK